MMFDTLLIDLFLISLQNKSDRHNVIKTPICDQFFKILLNSLINKNDGFINMREKFKYIYLKISLGMSKIYLRWKVGK